MRRFTRKSLKDSDIDIISVEKRLLEIAEAIKINNKNNLTDINVICEEIFGQVLNKLYNINLVSLSTEVSGNFIAVDLVDYKKRIAYQVTSQSVRSKIDKTIEKFNNSGLYKDIDELHFLILSSDEHKYNTKETLCLKNGTTFSYTNNIMNFNKLICEIKKKNELENGFIVDVYDCISMAYDSGRLKYSSIVNETESLMRTETYNSDETKLWLKGYGDVHLSAYIPLSYEEKLSCMLQIRQHNLSGVYITFNQDVLLEDYFVSETDFENKHHVGRNEDEEEIYMQLQNIRINLNAHTAYHIYKLFTELKEEYFLAKKQIESVLGAEGLSKEGNKYLLMTIDITEWEEILFFARNHDWFQDGDEIEWNIFNNNSSINSLILSPNVNGMIRGDILAKLSVAPNKVRNDKLDLYWEPGFKVNVRCMDCFDNVVKWKADYTAEWIKNKLLERAHTYYEKNNGNCKCSKMEVLLKFGIKKIAITFYTLPLIIKEKIFRFH